MSQKRVDHKNGNKTIDGAIYTGARPERSRGNNNGNVLTRVDASGTTTYNWDFENRLTSVVLPGTGGTVSFVYDPFGRRIRKAKSSTTIYVYDGADTLQEVSSTGTVNVVYTMAPGIDQPLAQRRGTTNAFYEQDGLGSITSLTTAAGAIGRTYTYDSYGRQTGSTGTVVNNFRYTAREVDPETGLMYYRARYYDQNVGRFISEDPVKFFGGVNFYRYVSNRPTSYSDPDGLKRCFYNVLGGTLTCFNNDLQGGPIVQINVASGNNGGGSSCKNNPKCENQPNRGPIPRGGWDWTKDWTGKPNGRVLNPMPGTDTFGRDLFRTHSCQNPFGPSLGPNFCSEGCITGTADDIQRLNQALDSDTDNTLSVGVGVTYEMLQSLQRAVSSIATLSTRKGDLNSGGENLRKSRANMRSTLNCFSILLIGLAVVLHPERLAAQAREQLPKEPKVVISRNVAKLVEPILDEQKRILAKEVNNQHRMSSLLRSLIEDHSRSADKALVVLMCYYIGESQEEVDSVIERGRRMVPILKAYRHKTPQFRDRDYPSTLYKSANLKEESFAGAIQAINSGLSGTPDSK